jgi:hypothetical protein
MQVTLNIPNPKAWEALQPLIQYLRISVVELGKKNISETILEKTQTNDSLISKIELMQKAKNDTLFQSDIQEIENDFIFIDHETF